MSTCEVRPDIRGKRPLRPVDDRVFYLVTREGGRAYVRASAITAVEVEQFSDADVVTIHYGSHGYLQCSLAAATEALKYFAALVEAQEIYAEGFNDSGASDSTPLDSSLSP
jgi:hypothetical protein